MMNSKRSIRHIIGLTLALSALCCLVISLGKASAHSSSSNLMVQQSTAGAQAPSPNVSCSATLSPTSQSFASNGGMDSFTVTIGPTCNWTAVASDPSWITINSGAGIGNGSVSYTVGVNNSNSARSGTITVADKTFTVLQGAFFADVPAENLFYTFIGKLSARGITTGCGLNGQNQRLYCPGDPVTREQMAAFIIRARGEFNPPTPQTQRFADVPPSNIFYNFIDRMAALNITSGCGGGNYCPSDPVTREQMAVFLVKAFNL